MRKVWIVVANSCVAKIYRAENVETLVEHKSFEHQESHMPSRDLVSDHLGRATQKGFAGSDTMQERTPLKLKEANAFAHQIAAFLQESYNKGEFERLYLIAKAPFLGSLRESLPANLTKIIESEIHKDLSQQTAREIRDYLPPVL